MNRAFSLCLTIGLVACAGEPEAQSQRSAVSAEASGSYQTMDAPVVSDSEGTVTADLIPKAGFIRVVRASAKSNIPDVKAEFYPGAFTYATQVTLQESPWNLAGPSLLKELGMDSDLYIQSIGTPVLLQWKYDENTATDYVLHIPDVASAAGAKSDTLVVFYKINLPETSEFNVGMIPYSKLSRADGLVSFTAKSYGIFQAATLSKVVEEGKETASDKPLDSGATAKPNGPPAAFSVVTDQIAAKDLHPAELRLMWNPASGATSYTILLDDDNENCKSPVKTIADLKVISTPVPTLDGQNYLCMFAVNANGQTAASNNGKLSFQADATPPPVPKGLKADVSGINVKVEWSEVEDGGFAYYELQIGTQKGGAEQFNGPIPTSTSYEFAGFATEETTYFARIRAFDKAGNASAWSKDIGPITQD